MNERKPATLAELKEQFERDMKLAEDFKSIEGMEGRNLTKEEAKRLKLKKLKDKRDIDKD